MSWRVVTERSEAVVQALIDEVPNAFQYCTDGFPVYEGRNYHRGWHLVAHGKSQTYSVEAGNAELRHYLKCLARSTRCRRLAGQAVGQSHPAHQALCALLEPTPIVQTRLSRL